MHNFNPISRNIYRQVNVKKYVLLFNLLFTLLFTQYLFAQPTITSFSPTSGPIGTTITITGTNFSTVATNNIVYFGAAKATVSAASSTSLTVKVPIGTTYKPITVTTNGLTAYSGKPFNVTFDGFSTIDGLFSLAKIDSTTGLHPNDIAISDIDGDGKADIATANNFSISNSPASVSILRNTGSNGKISFDKNVDLATGSMTYSIAAGDLNGDGKPDLVSTSIVDKTVSVLKNISTAGNISFAAKVDFATGINPFSVGIGDFDKDGKPDLVVANYLSNTISIFKNTSNNGSISFAPKTDLNTALGPYRVIVRDLDGDGKSDLAVSNNLSNSVSVFRNTSNNGSISFAPKVDFTAGSQPEGISSGDLDGDGNPDLLVVNHLTGSVSIYRNTSSAGTISFTTGSPINVFYKYPHNVAVGDMNGDGKLEVAVTGTESYLNPIYIFQNTSTVGNISFGTKLTNYSSSPFVVAFGDLDSDGKSDMAVTNFSNKSVSLFRNQVADPVVSSFKPTVAEYGTTDTITGSNFIGVTAVSFGGLPAKSFTVLNSTTIIAVVDTGKSGKVSVTTVHGTAQLDGFIFAGPPTIASFSPTIGTAGSTITITGTNLIGATNVNLGGVSATSFVVASADTIKANVGAGATGNISVITGYGTGTKAGFVFTPPPQITSFNPKSGPIGTIVTLNGNNFSAFKDSNIVYFGGVKAKISSATTNAIKVLVPPGAIYEPISLTTGPSNFTTYTSAPFNVTFPSTGVGFTSNSFSQRIGVATGFNHGDVGTIGYINEILSVGDLDGDGKTDLAVIGLKNYGYEKNYEISIFKNTSTNGAISFTGVADYFTYEYPVGISMADFNGDGKLDLAIANQGGSIWLLRNTSGPGNISFASSTFESSGILGSIAIKDLDGDGKPDIAVTSLGQIKVHRNTSTPGSISFAEGVYIGGHAGSGSLLSITDLDGDNKLEIVLSSNDDNSVAIFKNISSIGTILFASKVSYPAGSYPETVSIGDMDGDGKPDMAVAARGSAKIYIFKNESSSISISFTSAQIIEFNPSAAVFPISIADLDGDTKPDLIGELDSSISVFKNISTNGNISFANKMEYSNSKIPSYYGRIAAADIDGDGKPDIIEMKLDSMSVFRNQTGEPKVMPSGANPVTGNIVNRLTIDPSVQVFNGSPYVQRHYDIEPVNNPATATATVTLYFIQQDFDNFNAYPGHGANLPTGPTDKTGIANIRVYQYHGFSTTSLPGSYSGPGIEINPTDSNIIWNATAQWWEVTFDVSGFSGFFLSSAGNIALPLKLLAFSGSLEGKIASLEWITTNEVNVNHFELERSIDTRTFTTIKKINAANNNDAIATYEYEDTLISNSIYYYRLKMVDKDGKFTHSNVISLTLATNNSFLKIYPNPANEFLFVEHPATINAAQLKLVEISGRVVKTIKVNKGVEKTKVDINSLASGVYKIVWTDGASTKSELVIVK